MDKDTVIFILPYYIFFFFVIDFEEAKILFSIQHIIIIFWDMLK